MEVVGSSVSERSRSVKGEEDIFLNNIYSFLIKNLIETRRLKSNQKYNIHKETKEAIRKMSLGHSFQTMPDFIQPFLNVRSTNMLHSLEYINNLLETTVSDILRIPIYSKSVGNLKFENYSMGEVRKSYVTIIEQIYEPVNRNIFLPDAAYSDILSLNKQIRILDLLRLQKLKTLSVFGIIDLFLVKYKNVPNSNNNIFNFIFFLRRFPLFRFMFNKHLEEVKPEIFRFIKDDDLESINSQSETQEITNFKNPNHTFVPYFFDFESLEYAYSNIDYLIHNNTKNYFNSLSYRIPNLNIDMERLVTEYYEFRFNFKFKDFGFDNIDDQIVGLIDPGTFIRKLYQTTPEFKFYTIIKSYLCVYNIDPRHLKHQVENNNTESITTFISKMLFKLYFLYEYLNLSQFNDINQLLQIYEYKNSKLNINNIVGLQDFVKNSQTLSSLFYVYSAFILFQNNSEFHSSITKHVEVLKHIIYLVNNYHENDCEITPMFVFLFYSSTRVKAVYSGPRRNEENRMLVWLIEYYEELMAKEFPDRSINKLIISKIFKNKT